MTFNKGDRVRAVKTYRSLFFPHVPHFTAGEIYTVDQPRDDGFVSIVADDTGASNGIGNEYFVLAEKDTFTLGSPSIAADLRLKPQARKILGHLRKGLTISPLEAQNVYAVYRLAASIHEIRNAGYCVTTKNKQDLSGHKYARYSLAA